MAKTLKIDAVKVVRNGDVEITLSNGIEFSITPHEDRLYMHFSCLGPNGRIICSPTQHLDEDPKRELDLANYLHIHLPHKDV